MKNKDLLFLLDVVPLNELSDTLSEVIEKYRYSSITLENAISLLNQKCGEEIKKFILKNKELSKEFEDLIGNY